MTTQNSYRKLEKELSKNGIIYISIRNLTNIDKEVFTTRLNVDDGFGNISVSISQYANPEGQEVLILKVSHNGGQRQDDLRAFIKREENWSEIMTDS